MSARVSNVYKRFEPCENIVVLPNTLLYKKKHITRVGPIYDKTQ